MQKYFILLLMISMFSGCAEQYQPLKKINSDNSNSRLIIYPVSPKDEFGPKNNIPVIEHPIVISDSAVISQIKNEWLLTKTIPSNKPYMMYKAIFYVNNRAREYCFFDDKFQLLFSEGSFYHFSGTLLFKHKTSFQDCPDYYLSFDDVYSARALRKGMSDMGGIIIEKEGQCEKWRSFEGRFEIPFIDDTLTHEEKWNELEDTVKTFIDRNEFGYCYRSDTNIIYLLCDEIVSDSLFPIYDILGEYHKYSSIGFRTIGVSKSDIELIAEINNASISKITGRE